jgi:hypothetical protein
MLKTQGKSKLALIPIEISFELALTRSSIAQRLLSWGETLSLGLSPLRVKFLPSSNLSSSWATGGGQQNKSKMVIQAVPISLGQGQRELK